MQTKSIPKNVVVWSKHPCPWCDRAKELLTSKNITYTEKLLGTHPREEFNIETKNSKSVPQILFDGELIGGFYELQRALTSDYDKTTKVV